MAQETIIEPVDYLIDDPGPFATLETWERHLEYIKNLPGRGEMKMLALKHTREIVAEKRAEAKGRFA